ncbi:MAG: LysE family translocator [Aeromonas sp.]
MLTSLFVTLGLMHLIALASPGPDFALILRTSLHRPTALGAALGISLAIMVHATLSLTGISMLIANNPMLFMVIKCGGALYLGWLGWGALMAARQQSGTVMQGATNELRGWGWGVRAGIATNLLNPKALVYFIGMLAAMVSPEVDGVARSLLVAELFIISLCWFGMLAWSLSTSRAQQQLLRVQRPLNLVTGVLFATVSLSILASMGVEFIA